MRGDEKLTKIVMLAALVMVVATVSFIIGAIAAAAALTNDDDYLDKLPERENEDEQQRNCDLPVLQEEEKQRE
jgi:hypothetical protein